MSVPTRRSLRELIISPVSSTTCKTDHRSEKILCERCDAEMYRMHAVWRCPKCGFKTDCCGW